MTRLLKRMFRCAFAAVLLSAVLVPSASALRVHLFVIGDFVPTIFGGCGADDRTDWPTMTFHWFDEMGKQGHTQGSSSNPVPYVDGNMTQQRFCDTSYRADCLDTGYADWADATMIGTHGWDALAQWAGVMRFPWAGHCDIQAGGFSNRVHWGDFRLKFIHVSSCYSADDDNLQNIRIAMQDTSSSTTRRAHLWLGFHGIMWINTNYIYDYRGTARDGHAVSLGYSWVVHHFKNNEMGCAWWDPFGDLGTCRSDQCPISYAIGANPNDATTRVWNERYNFVYSHPSSIDSYAYIYYGNCDPYGETAFDP